MRENIIAIVKTGIFIIGTVFFLGFGVGGSKMATDNATVYVNDTKKTYIGESSIREHSGEMRVATLKEAHKLNFFCMKLVEITAILSKTCGV